MKIEQVTAPSEALSQVRDLFLEYAGSRVVFTVHPRDGVKVRKLPEKQN